MSANSATTPSASPWAWPTRSAAAARRTCRRCPKRRPPTRRMSSGRPWPAAAAHWPPLPERVAPYEAHVIEEALPGCGGDVRAALEVLRIPRKPFYDKVERHALDLHKYRQRR